MCGIVGIIGRENTHNLGKTLLSGIKRLEYRGYDSVGMAVLNDGIITIKKGVGAVDEVKKKKNSHNLRAVQESRTPDGQHTEVSLQSIHTHTKAATETSQ